MNHTSFEVLLDKYLTGSISEEERVLLSRMLEEKKHQEKLEVIIDKELEEHSFEIEEDGALLDKIQVNIREKITEEGRPAKVVWLNWRRVAVAAVFILLLGSGAYLFLHSNKEQHGNVAVQNKPDINKDIAPGTNKAVLQLADGTQILLDSASKGALAQQGKVQIVKLDNGQLAYEKQVGKAGQQGRTSKPPEVLYNTITTPKGGQYQLVLADGTKVWLNAASSLRFPASFVGKERVVELKGEGYFEVAKNAAMPFHVRVNDLDVQVLGTHFNINAYLDENAMRTTLLEGNVKVAKGAVSRMLKPGQQAAANQSGQIKVEEDVNLEEVVAWKNGLFYFKSADLETIMRQAARWYDIDIIYKEKIKDRFSGQIPRNVNLSQLLKILEYTGLVQFDVEGRKIIVKSKG